MKRTFKVKVGDKELELAVQTPNSEVTSKGQLVYAKAWRDALAAGAASKAEVESILRERRAWTDSMAEQEKVLRKRIFDGEVKLAKGGAKLSEGKDIAIDIRRARNELQRLMLDWNSVDASTAESLGENAKFNYFVSVCTVYSDTGKRYFKDLESYQSDDEADVAVEAAREFSHLYYGLDKDFVANLPENKFLKKYKLCDDKLALVDKSGNRINVDGKRVDDRGNLLNENGEIVDEDGNVFDVNGNLKVDFKPFTDDEGNPIEVSE